MTTNDGGPAFPVPSYVNDLGETHTSVVQGMSLRDWFAGQALVGKMAETDPDPDMTCEQAAAVAYALANAMLAAREASK